MATELQIFDHAYKAGADLSAKKGFVAKLTAAQTVGLASADDDISVGIIVEGAKQNNAVRVRHIGIAKAVAGAAITAGLLVVPDANGKVVAGAITNDQVPVGVALEAALADGDVIPVLLAGIGQTAGA